MELIALVCAVCGVGVDQHHERGHNFTVRDDQGVDRGNRAGHYEVIQYRVIPLAAPAVGTDIVITVPPTSNWRIEAFQAQLVTSAVVANRVPHLFVDDGQGHSMYNFPSTGNQVAATTVQYSAGPAIVAVTFDNAQTFVIPAHLLLLNSWRIGFKTTALDVGDQWSNVNVLVKEWLQF
jgi:hypothetical protein